MARKVSYRKLFNKYKKKYSAESAKLFKKGLRWENEMMNYQQFKATLEATYSTKVEKSGGKRVERSNLLTEITHKDIYGSYFKAKQVKEYKAHLTKNILEKGFEPNREITELNKIKNMSSAEIRAMLKEQLPAIYKDLKTGGMTTLEAKTWISQHCFGSD